MVKLSPGFKIDPQDMDNLSLAFRNISGEYRTALPGVIAIPRSGSAGIDRAMATTLKTVNEMHSVLCEAMEEHSRKLGAAATNYLAVEGETKSAVEQVKSLVALGTPVERAESVVVAEYLGGRPGYMPQGPTQAPTIYGGEEGKTANGNPVLAKVPNPTEIAARRSWVQFQHHIIAFDYSGLWRLVDELNSFIRSADPLVIQLSRKVLNFCSPYHNYGDAVYQFNATFSEDVSLASGFHKVVSTISATIDSFANAMAEKEAWLEQFAYKCKVPESLLAYIGEGHGKEEIRRYLKENSSADTGGFSICVTACKKVLRQAESIRRKTASQLIVLAETIASGGLDYYTKKDNKQGSADPGGLFSGSGARHKQITNQLEAELADDGKRLKDSPEDLKTALSGISKVGGYGGQIGGIVGGIESVQKSKDLFETTKNVGNLAGVVGPALETLGLLVFAE